MLSLKTPLYLIITHKFLGPPVERGAKAEIIRCLFNATRLATIARKNVTKDMGNDKYLDTLLAAFPQQSKAQKRQPKRAGEHTKMQPLLDTLSERELEVLQLLVHGASNQEIAQQLVIAIDTVKRHVSHIFSKLDVQNRVQALIRAKELGLLDKDF